MPGLVKLRVSVIWNCFLPHCHSPHTATGGGASVPPCLAACLAASVPPTACTLPAAGSDVFDKDGRFVMEDFDRAKPMASAAC